VERAHELLPFSRHPLSPFRWGRFYRLAQPFSSVFLVPTERSFSLARADEVQVVSFLLSGSWRRESPLSLITSAWNVWPRRSTCLSSGLVAKIKADPIRPTSARPPPLISQTREASQANVSLVSAGEPRPREAAKPSNSGTLAPRGHFYYLPIVIGGKAPALDGEKALQNFILPSPRGLNAARLVEMSASYIVVFPHNYPFFSPKIFLC